MVGWDVQQRLRTAGELGDMRGFHPPGVVGPLGAVAGVINLLGLDVERTTMALGLAASRTGGLFANNGTMTKATHPGNAARVGRRERRPRQRSASRATRTSCTTSVDTLPP